MIDNLRKFRTGSGARRLFCTIIVLTMGAAVLSRAVFAGTVDTPIVAYWNPGGNLLVASAQEAVDGGYNVVPVTVEAWQLSVAQQYGLRAQISSPWLTPSSLDGGTSQVNLNTVLNLCMAFPSGYSYFLADEPGASQFSGLGQLVSYIRQYDPNHLAYINVLGYGDGTSDAWGTSNYSTYINQFISTVQPSMLSYDNYTLTKTGDGSNYLLNLGIISTAAKQAGIPFMQIVQACGNDSVIGTNYRVPNANELRYEVYTTLAYGAQGISYYNYYTHSSSNGGLSTFDGTLTPVYIALTPLNKQFTNIATQYQSLKLIGDYLKGYKANSMPPGTTQLPSNSPFDISSVSNNMSYSTGAPLKGLLFGFFDKNGTTLADATVALVENLDYTSSYTYTVSGPGNLSIFDADMGVWTAMGSNRVTLNLLPGGGVLVGLTSVVPEPSAIVLLLTGSACAYYAWRKRKQK